MRNEAPAVETLPNGMIITERRLEADYYSAEYGIATVVARAALIEEGYINHPTGVVSSILPNRIGAPSTKVFSNAGTQLREDIVKANFLGHLAAGHCAWLETAVDWHGYPCVAIHCVDCDRASEARRAEDRADRP